MESIPPPWSWKNKSPSMRREWIEITMQIQVDKDGLSLPPCGGSGLKYHVPRSGRSVYLSPSMRREWIEIVIISVLVNVIASPSMRREWIEIAHDFLS